MMKALVTIDSFQLNHVRDNITIRREIISDVGLREQWIEFFENSDTSRPEDLLQESQSSLFELFRGEALVALSDFQTETGSFDFQKILRQETERFLASISPSLRVQPFHVLREIHSQENYKVIAGIARTPRLLKTFGEDLVNGLEVTNEKSETKFSGTPSLVVDLVGKILCEIARDPNSKANYKLVRSFMKFNQCVMEALEG